MAVNRDDGIFNTWCMFFDVTDFVSKLIRVHVTYCIWYINNCSATSDSHAEYFTQEIQVCTSRIFTGELNFIEFTFCKFQDRFNAIQYLLTSHFQFIFHVDFGCSDKHMQTAALCIFQRISHLLHVLFVGTGQATNRCAFNLASNRLYRFKISRGCSWEASLDYVDAEAY